MFPFPAHLGRGSGCHADILPGHWPLCSTAGLIFISWFSLFLLSKEKSLCTKHFISLGSSFVCLFNLVCRGHSLFTIEKARAKSESVLGAQWWSSQSSSCGLCWSKKNSAAASDEFIPNMVSVVVTEKQPSCPEACRTLLDTSVPAHRVSRRSSRAIVPIQLSMETPAELERWPGRSSVSTQAGTNDMCNQMRLHCGSSSVSLPTSLLLHGGGHFLLFRTFPGKVAVA